MNSAKLKETIANIVKEESEYQVFFRKALEKAGKSITDMSDEEKKDFFNKIDAAWDGKGEKNEGNAFGAAVVAAKKAGEDEFEVGGKTFKVEESTIESVNEVLYKDAVAKFNDELIKHPMVKKLAQHYKKTPAEIIKVLQQRLSTKGNRGGDTKEVSINFKDNDSGITIKHKTTFNESVVTEGAGTEAMGIAAFTGTRGDAVQKFIDDNKLDAKKLFNYVKVGKLKERMDFVTALVGNPGNKIQKMIISKFGIKESVNEASYDLGNQEYTNRKLTPTQILDLAMAYANVSGKGNPMYNNKMEKMIKVANDLAKLTGTKQMNPKARASEPALILFLLKNKLVTQDEYVKLYKNLSQKHIAVANALKNADPASRMIGGVAARQAHKDMRGEFDSE
jgi:hypothetical protein